MLRKILLIVCTIISVLGAAALSVLSVWELRNVFNGDKPDFIHVFSLVGSIIGIIVLISVAFFLIIKILSYKKEEK